MAELTDILALDSGGLRDWRGVSFVEFTRELRVKQTPGQLALSLVVFDGLQPEELPSKLQSIARELFGDVKRFHDACRKVIVLVIGGRAGKSFMFSALRAIHAAVSSKLEVNHDGKDGLAEGERAFATIVAPEPEQREQCFGYVLGAIASHPDLTAMAVAAGGKLGPDGKLDTGAFGNAQSIDLLRSDGFRACIRTIPAKRGGGALRGAWHIFCALEEAAFFRDANNVVNDKDLFTSVAPRILPGGQLMVSSTPWTETGILAEEFFANHPEPWRAAPHIRQPGNPHRAIAAHAPTLLLRNTPLMQAAVAAEYERDEWNAKREFGAQFLGLGSQQFFDPRAIAECIDYTLENGSPPSGNPQAIFVQGNDLGFSNDAAAGTVVERNPDEYRLLAYKEIFAAVESLKPSEVLAGLAGQARQYPGVEEMAGDGHYVETAKEAFWESGLIWITTPAGAQGKAEMFTVARLIIEERKARIPNDARFLQQLREVRKRALPGGGIAIEQPRRKTTQTGGGHGDVASAFVASLWRLSKLQLPEAPVVPPEDPRTRAAQEWEQRIEAKRAEAERRQKLEFITGMSYDDA